MSHGLHFIEYDQQILLNELSRLKPLRETNILILSNSDVDKSMWINGITNYLHFNTLDDAISYDKLICVTPAKFSFTDVDGCFTNITVGEENVVNVKNKNILADEEPVTYSFYIDNHVIRLIDTPAIVILKKSKSVNNILPYLSYFGDIHAICIVLKSNNCDVGNLFDNCVDILLTQLQKNVKNNVAFCFTNVQESYYKPGNTLVDLRKRLLKVSINWNVAVENMFCFDNASFGFLACVKHGMKFGEAEKAAFSGGWDFSVKETNRLFEYIRTRTPNFSSGAVCLNEARRIMVELSRPMAEVILVLQRNLAELERRMNDTTTQRADFNGYTIEYEHLEHPRTVCRHGDCLKYCAIGRGNVKQLTSRQCHQQCYLCGISSEVVGGVTLSDCAILTGNGNRCLICGHSNYEHVYQTYDLITVKACFVSEEVRRQCEVSQQSSMDTMKSLLNELHAEQKEVLLVLAQFMKYLKSMNTISYCYSDQLSGYLEKLTPLDFISKNFPLDSIAQDYSYMINPLISTPTITSPQEVIRLQHKLFNFKYFGATLKDIFYKIENSRKAHQINRQVEMSWF